MTHFEAFWRGHGMAHFEIEERLILPALPAGDAEWSAGVERVQREHAALRGQAGELLAPGGRTQVGLARALGDLLNDHVRFEERELFVLLEERLAPGDLDDLGRRVAAAESSAHSPS